MEATDGGARWAESALVATALLPTTDRGARWAEICVRWETQVERFHESVAVFQRAIAITRQRRARDLTLPASAPSAGASREQGTAVRLTRAHHVRAPLSPATPIRTGTPASTPIPLELAATANRADPASASQRVEPASARPELVRARPAPMPPQVAGTQPAPVRDGRLTGRELEVAMLIAQGYTNQRIAERLVIAQGTVANHAEHIRRKLGVRCRAQIAAWAVEQRLAPR